MIDEETTKWVKELDSESAVVYRWIGEDRIRPFQIIVTANEITRLPRDSDSDEERESK